MQRCRMSRAVVSRMVILLTGWGLAAQKLLYNFQNVFFSSVFSHLKVLNVKDWGKWNLCLLAGKGVEIAKKPLYGVSRHLFFYVRQVFLLFTHLNMKRCWNSRTAESRMVILLISWGLQKKLPLFLLVLSRLKMQRCRISRAVVGRMVILLTGWGPGISSETSTLSFKTYFFLCVFPFEGAEFQSLREVECLASCWQGPGYS